MRPVADAHYAGVHEPLVLLTIDERRVTVPLQVDAVPGQAEGYPHLYGPLEMSPPVVLATPLLRDHEGRLQTADLP